MLKVEYKTTTSSYDVTMPELLQLSKNFVLRELANNEGNPAKAQYIISLCSMSFNELFQKFREEYGKPIQPTSGYRQPEYNKKVGGDPKSLHMQACAVDFIDKYSMSDFYMLSLWIGILAGSGIIGAINIYANGDFYRYHLEAFSDRYLGYTKSRIRVYTNKAHFTKIANFYKPLGIEVTYHGN